MKFKFPYNGFKAGELIRRCGYGEVRDPNATELSYARRLGSGFYPRFHAYLNDFENYFEVNLHLDQKKPSYEGSSAHAGEYDGETVENEARRITSMIKQIFDSKN
ncbi:hypothetical protein KKC32_02525 [Patescibacteria group bacterium]|nr:hypothetical protein [Patescibacteria group bacterium]